MGKSGVFMEKTMKKYIVFVKLSSGKSNMFCNGFSKMSDERARKGD